MFIFKRYKNMLKAEFTGYNLAKFGKDALSGITVAAVALPLALAFGVASGASAAAGLVTAIVAGLVISIFGGASFQISGPTGAMSAVLIGVVAGYGLGGVFLACIMAGIILLVAGLLKLGKLIAFIPMPVITGFTSGIAIIIALGQIDNFFGTVSSGATAIEKIVSYFTLGFHPNWWSVMLGGIVILIMALYPKKWNRFLPGSLVAIIVSGAVAAIFSLDVAKVGEIPRTIFLPERLSFSDFTFSNLTGVLGAAFTIAALGMVESLLCGAAAARMKSSPFDADTELIAQGIGNIVVPFFGGVPATAAIARTSVAIKSGSVTRVTGIFQSLGLLACMFLLSPVMAQLPLAALAGVLMMTAFRMNEWHFIKYIFSHKFKGAIAKFLITLVATVVFDLTIAILIGVVFSLLLFAARSSKLRVETSAVLNNRLRGEHGDVEEGNRDTVVIYVTGALFFANGKRINEAVERVRDKKKFIFAMRGVTYMDLSAATELSALFDELKGADKEICVSGLLDNVKSMFDRAGLTEKIGADRFYTSVDKILLQSPDCETAPATPAEEAEKTISKEVFEEDRSK